MFTIKIEPHRITGMIIWSVSKINTSKAQTQNIKQYFSQCVAADCFKHLVFCSTILCHKQNLQRQGERKIYRRLCWQTANKTSWSNLQQTQNSLSFKSVFFRQPAGLSFQYIQRVWGLSFWGTQINWELFKYYFTKAVGLDWLGTTVCCLLWVKKILVLLSIILVLNFLYTSP